MFKTIENIKLFEINFGKTRNKGEGFSVNKRKSHIFIFRTEGRGVHSFNGKDIYSAPGDMVYIPMGFGHNFTAISDEPCSSIFIAFLADIKNPTPALYNLDGLPEKDAFPLKILKLWCSASQSDKHLCMAMFHTLIAHILKLEETEYSAKTKRHIIEPAIEYINAHIFESTLKIDILPSLCGISPAYFRKIFHANFGINPQKYIEDKRLSQAATFLVNKNYKTIAETARAVGYDDPLYFSKVFKNNYGTSPSAI